MIIGGVLLGALGGWAAFGPREPKAPTSTRPIAVTQGSNSPAQAAAQSGQGNTQTVVAGNQINYPLPPSPKVPRARVRINAMDNGASEHGLRWFHLRAFTETSVLAKGASLRVRVLGGGPERWLWANCLESISLGQQGHEIPLVAGTFPAYMARLQVGWHLLPRIWYRTPNCNSGPGSQIAPFGPDTCASFEVTVSWLEGDHEAWSRAEFELRQDDTLIDAWLVKTSESDSFTLAPPAG